MNTPSLFFFSCSAISSTYQAPHTSRTISQVTVNLADVNAQLIETQSSSSGLNMASYTTHQSLAPIPQTHGQLATSTQGQRILQNEQKAYFIKIIWERICGEGSWMKLPWEISLLLFPCRRHFQIGGNRVTYLRLNNKSYGSDSPFRKWIWQKVIYTQSIFIFSKCMHRHNHFQQRGKKSKQPLSLQ